MSQPLTVNPSSACADVAGDSIAQFRERYRRRKQAEEEIEKKKPCCRARVSATPLCEKDEHLLIRTVEHNYVVRINDRG